MNYGVEWVPIAQNRLAALWVNASDRAAVAAAADAIDARLARDPYANSESRTGSVRVTFEPPLGVQYDVDDARRRVTVLWVWSFQ